MRNFLKRTIVCLTAVALALPTWLIGDFLNPTYAKAEGTDSPYKGQVFINEIYADGTAEWIELRNTTRKSITFQNWLVEDEPTESGTIHNKTISGTLPAGGVLVFEGNFYLNDTGDTAYLLDDNGSFVDGINFTEDFGQKSLGRMDDSSDTLNQFTLPTKGWFNSQNLSIASVVSGLETAGITTNLASFTDLNHVDGLFFEKQGVGRLVFDQQELNLNNIFLFPGIVGVDFAKGHLAVANPDGLLSNIGASVELTGIDPQNYPAPAILVDGRPVKENEITGLTNNSGILRFVVPKFGFSQIGISFREIDSTKYLFPTIGFDITNPEGKSYPLSADGTTGYKFYTNRITPTDENRQEYLVQLNNSIRGTVDFDQAGSEQGYFGLYLADTTVSRSDLTAYYSAKPEPWKSYLEEAAKGLYVNDQGLLTGKPFVYLYQDAEGYVHLADAARYDLIPSHPSLSMAIPGNYPVGQYTLTGDIRGTDGVFYAVSFQIEVAGLDQTAPTGTIVINGGDNVGSSAAVSLLVTGSDESGVAEIGLSNDNESFTWQAYSEATIPWTFETTAGKKTVYAKLKDTFGNVSAPISASYLIPSLNQVVIQENLVLGTSAPEVLIGSNDTTLSTINIPADVTNAQLNFSTILSDSTVTTPGPLNLVASTSIGTVSVNLPDDLTINGGSSWNGVVNVPTIKMTDSIPAITAAGVVTETKSVVEIGFDDLPLTFDKAVRILLTGQAGRLVGYSRSGNFTPITNICSGDSQAIGNNLAAGGDCKIEIDTDSDGANDSIVIWTKHFTKFVTYTQQTVANPAFTVGKVLIGDSKYIKAAWTGTGADTYQIYIDGMLSRTITRSATDSSYAEDLKVLTDKKYDILVTAKISGVESVGGVVQSVDFSVVIPSKPLEIITGEEETQPVIAPTPAKAADNPKPAEEKEKQPDQNGQIKGTESPVENDAAEDVNWTPWIVLFILILLAGTATGGYFYWFAGKEDVEGTVTPLAKIEPTKSAPKTPEAVKVKKTQKKHKRW